MITKTDFDAKLSSLNRKITQNKTKHLFVESELNKLKTFDSSYFIGKSHFDEDGTQNYLVLHTINKHFKGITNTDYVSSWKFKGLSSESIKSPTTSDNSLTPALNYYGTKTRVKYSGSCLKQAKNSYNQGNSYIFSERLKKEDAPGNLYKASTDNMTLFNRDRIFTIYERAKLKNGTYLYWDEKDGKKNNCRFLRQELFALSNQFLR